MVTIGETASYNYKQIRVTVDQAGIAIVTLSQPEKLNAVGEVLHIELSLLFREINRDPSVRVVILTGEGKAFSAGGDLDFMQDMVNNPAIFERVTREAKEIVFSMLDCEKPLIAKVNGHAIGLGATLALLCDVVIMSSQAKIGDPHVGVGLVAADGGAIIWAHLIGYARAKRYLMTGDLLSAEEAEHIGLISQVCEPDGLDAVVYALAKRLTSGAQQAIRWTKLTMNLGLKQTALLMLDTGLAYEYITNLSSDHQEAIKAFKQKRMPVFL